VTEIGLHDRESYAESDVRGDRVGQQVQHSSGLLAQSPERHAAALLLLLAAATTTTTSLLVVTVLALCRLGGVVHGLKVDFLFPAGSCFIFFTFEFDLLSNSIKITLINIACMYVLIMYVHIIFYFYYELIPLVHTRTHLLGGQRESRDERWDQSAEHRVAARHVMLHQQEFGGFAVLQKLPPELTSLHGHSLILQHDMTSHHTT
jgi:hypothetical protein